VVFQGELLPDGTPAEAMYLVLSEPYREILNHAPVQPLDYAYLQALTPMAQRFYELLSYTMFATLTHRRPHATLRYGAYCLLSTQQRYTAYEQVKKQMYKVHRPHLAVGYIAQVRSTATTDADGQPDWLLHYTPGPKTRAEYAAFMRQPGVETALPRPEDAEPADLLALVMPETPATKPPEAPQAPVVLVTPPASPAPTTEPAAPPHPQAETLVQQFYQRFHGLAQVTPTAKELTQATALLTTHGLEKAQYLLTFSHQAAQATQYHPQVFGGILHYTDRALAAYDARAVQDTQATTRQAAADERTQREQHLAWEQQELARLRAALPPAALAALEAAARARLVAEGTPVYALGLAVRAAVDAVLEAQAGRVLRANAPATLFLQQDPREIAVLQGLFELSDAEVALFDHVRKHAGWSSAYLRLPGHAGGIIRLVPNALTRWLVSQDDRERAMRNEVLTATGGDLCQAVALLAQRYPQGPAGGQHA
jgi:hypothetical protein